MTAEEWNRLQPIVDEALELDPVERDAYLGKVCGDDAELRRDARALIEASEKAEGSFLSSVIETRAKDLLQLQEDPGETGRYHIEAKLGEGGMGIVYRAHQASPVTRDVALKIIRPGMASPQLVARFEIERRALAIMDHPNIARVLDAGATSRGLPYLVMELVEGRNIAVYCKENGVILCQRLELMIPVCQAIQHAHHKGIIHRDIKPVNVLVATYDGKPVPKVIDFGIAKAIESTQIVPPGSTRAGMMVGTFEYVSPEQVDAGVEDVDTRTDIYSLGVLLYELITGRPPLTGLSLEGQSYSEIVRRIRQEMPRPASRVVKASHELDWILGKALEKDRERRYQTAEALAMDLRRYLDGEPVEAAPPSTAYRLRKFAGKFKYWIAAAAALVVFLIASVGFLSYAQREQARANSNAGALREVVRRIVVDRFARLATDTNRTALQSQLLSDAEGAVQMLSLNTGNDPGIQYDLARAYEQIGRTRGGFSTTGSEGDANAGLDYLGRALEIYEKLVAKEPDHFLYQQARLAALSSRLAILRGQHKFDLAEQTAQRLLILPDQLPEKIRRGRGALKVKADAYRELCEIRTAQGREREAYGFARQALETFSSVASDPDLTDVDRDTLAALLANAAFSGWDWIGLTAETERLFDRGIALTKPCTEPSCRVRQAELSTELGTVQFSSGKRLEGIASVRHGLAGYEDSLRKDPTNKVLAGFLDEPRGWLALMLSEPGPGSSLVEALSIARQLVAAAKDRPRERALIDQLVLGTVLVNTGYFPEAETVLQTGLDRSQGWAAADMRWGLLSQLAHSLDGQRKFEAAAAAAREAIAEAAKSIGTGLPTRTRRAIAARDYARVVTRWKLAGADVRADAARRLDTCCSASALPSVSGRVQTGVLWLSPPSRDEVDALKAALTRPGNETAASQAGASSADARAGVAGGGMARARAARLLPISCRAGNLASMFQIPGMCEPVLVANAE